MTAPISLVIPTLNAEAELPHCLAALTEGLTAGLVRELVISDGGSGDATREIADAVGAELIEGPASRGGQLRRGVAATRGDWLLVLHADTVLTPGWTAAVGAHLRQDDAPPAYFRLRFRDGGRRGRLVAGWANLRAGLFALPYGDQGLLIRRRDYEAAGGYPDQPLMEDVALVRRLGRPLTALPVIAETSARHYARRGWLRRGARNLWTLARYFGGADPEGLAARYYR
ncbi:TIGR04283 family arsenosugar biosynthesis glycosyltransferase [Pseudodonghicola flavimaris]|uniref:TIGR04283 family arsenosugar biosynthesis glycosyltransferase n=1 Tax=Pseudodonghicola flavimaris TaxID=3050036 RepID=A0ABT7F5X9_9RHOB|nr:TIGR04283 family arsenosugar biosynthesis glycosyltransferase [Pseudodonghicola flavimaris]MDK3020010.1 TIGR04283 family arsenosugar biosynthesis glycosyltransferase [Pseudodonghicola flavimaris]